MKKIFFAAGIAVIGLSAAFAQDQKKTTPISANQQESTAKSSRVAGARNLNPQKVAEIRTARLNSEVTLTEDQKKKVQEVFLQEAQNNQGRAALREETNKQIKAILTAEQNQKMEAAQAERNQKIQERRAMKAEPVAAPGKAESENK